MENQTAPSTQNDQTGPATPPPQSTVSPSKQNSLPALVLTVLAAATIFGLGGYFLGKKTAGPPKNIAPTDPQTTPAPISATPTLAAAEPENQLLAGLLKLPKMNSFQPKTEKEKMWWVSDDNWSILAENAESIEMVKPEAYEELKNSGSPTSEIIAAIAGFFENQGFTLSRQNLTEDLDDNHFYDYIRGYQTETDKCLISVNPDKGYYGDKNGNLIPEPNITVSCVSSADFEKSYQEQIPFLIALNDRKAGVIIEKSNALAASINVRWRRTGASALFSKKSGVWEKIHLGHEKPACSLLKEYSFPAEIYQDCI